MQKRLICSVNFISQIDTARIQQGLGSDIYNFVLITRAALVFLFLPNEKPNIFLPEDPWRSCLTTYVSIAMTREL